MVALVLVSTAAVVAVGVWMWRVVYWHVQMPSAVSDAHAARERFPKKE